MFNNTKPFGTASAFGASTFGNTSTPFGQNTTAFGAKPATSNVFGSTGFGVQTPAASMSGGLFGSSTPATGTGLFGQPTTAFGAPASTSSGGFGGFGATSNSGSLFGSTTPSTQSTGGLFGATNTSAFGTPRPAFGGFGATNTGTGLFGQNTTAGSGLFGSTGGFNAAAPSGTTVKFNPPTGTDTMMKGGVSTSIGTRHQCITCMKEYENKSLEELRVEDYAANRKGSSNPGIGFGTPTQQAGGGLFGAPAAASTSAFSFGNTTQSKPLFGTTGTGMTNTFGSGGSLFGQTAQNQNTGLFGKSVGFGAPSTSAAPAFSFGGTNNTSLFGQNNQQKPLFGQTTGSTGLFGNTATTQATGFGTSTGFGGFGVANQQSTGLFGAKPTGFGTTNTTTTSTFSFGNTNSMTGGGLFGQKPAAPAFGSTGFGTQTSGFGSFGATQAAGTNLFAQNKPATSAFGGTGNLFGGGLGTSFGTPSTFSMGLGTNTGTGLFGGTNTNKAAGFSFGNNNSTGFNFGGTNPNTSSFNFGGGASSLMPSSDPNQSAALQQIQNQIYAMTVNPFGDSPLFRNPIKDSSREIEVLKPTNPSAQKALLNDNHYKVDLLPTAKIKPKPWAPASTGKVFLFDGLEDEEPSLGAAAFVPKRSVKKLILKNIGNTSSSLTLTSDIATTQPTRIDVSISLKSPQNTSDKSPGESMRNVPLTSDVTTMSRDSTLEKRLLSGGGERSLLSNISPEKAMPVLDKPADLVTNFNDSIADLHTNKQKFTSHTYNIWNESIEENSDNRHSLEESLHTSTEVDPNPKSHPTGIILTRSSYYTVPSFDEMISMMDENKCCLVNYFTVGRRGYGKVVFPGVTNVAGLNLDEIVCFQKKEITIYPDDDKKPPIGEELNKRAEVTLENVWPTDKTTHTLIKDPERLDKMGYREKIRNSTIKLGARFIDYLPQSGSWVFQVEHFSKYGIEDSDEEMDVVKPPENKPKTVLSENQVGHMNGFLKTDLQKQSPLQKSSASLPHQDQEMETVFPHMQSSHLEFLTDKSLTRDFAMPTKQAFNSFIDAERIKGMKASFFEAEMEDDIFASPLYTGKKDNFIYKNKEAFDTPLTYTSQLQPSTPSGDGVLKKLRYLDYETDHSSLSSFKKPEIGIQKSLSSLSISATQQPEWLSDLPIVKSSYEMMPPYVKTMPSVVSKVYLKPLKESVLFGKQHLLADAGNFMGRSFRVGWTSTGSFISLTNFEETQTDPIQKLLYSALKDPRRMPYKKPSFMVSLKKVPLYLLENDTGKKIEKSLVDALELQLKNSASTMDGGAPLFVPKPGIEPIHELSNLFEHHLKDSDPLVLETDFLRQCVYVWDLLVALWCKVRGLDTDENVSSFAIQMARREAVSRWLIKTTKLHLTKSIADVPEDKYLKKIFLCLSGRQTKEAIKIAQEHRDFRMSLLLSQAEGTAIVRKLIGKQLMNWDHNDACKFMSSDRMVVYTLLSGMMIWENKYECINLCENLNWKQALSLQLWYHCNSNASIQEAVKEYDLSFQAKYSSPPKPSYLENLDINTDMEYDTCYHILKLYCDRSHRFDLLLMPETYSADHLDYRLSWFLDLALSSIGYNIPSDLTHTLHSNFAAQLESLDLWHWAIFVALHHTDSHWRTKSVKEILLRHVSLEQNKQMSERETFLVERLSVPAEWIFEAKAIKASNLGSRDEEAWYLLKAGSWSKSHSIVIKYLASNAIINEDFDYLMQYLSELSLPERSCTIQDWCSGGQVYLDYIHMCQVVQEVLSHEASAYDLEKFTPEVVSLCKRLSSIQISSLEDSLSVAEMAKKTATILRSISILQFSRTNNTSCLTGLTQSLKNLPMPYDYAVPENRFVAHCLMDQITAGN